MTSTGPVARTLSWGSVTSTAISITRSESGCSPVISMSIQIRLLGSPAMDYSLTGMSNAFTWVFLAALAAASATRLWLTLRQIRHVRAHRGAVPGMFAETIPLSAHQKAADYTMAKARLGIVDTVLDVVILLALTLGGALQWLADSWARAFSVESLWHGTAVILSVFLLKGVLGLPPALLPTFLVQISGQARGRPWHGLQ